MKTLGKIILCSAIVLGGTATGQGIDVHAAAKPAGVSIVLDGYPLPFSEAPVVIKGTTMVPFRTISDALDISVEWNQKLKKITATRTEGTVIKKVELTLGNKKALVNGTAVELTMAPRTINNSTMVPLSFFGTQFGAAVAWDQPSQTVSITSPKKDMYTLGFYALASYDEYALLPSFDAAAFGWSRIDRSGEFTTQGEDYRWPQAAGAVTPDSIVSGAAQSGTTPYLMVYSVDGKLELTKNLEDMELQARTIAGIVDTATQKGFQGIMLDLEGLGMSGDTAKARADYNGFVKKLSEQARQSGLKLGVILHPLNSSYSGYDYKTLGTVADELIIMAYAYGDEKSPEPVNKVDEAIRLALKQTTKDKLVLGISLASEDESSVNIKIGLAKRYDLKGIAIWRLGIIGQPAWTQMKKSVEL
ncbi:stalk domain-containing protein [Paenibacillus sp. sgz500958]|uniref:stalk domain-containing protein n=1 Tax=Paenibacillus sp. sgz500958 TaxID=3242475 RepID=UPI0036D2247C